MPTSAVSRRETLAILAGLAVLAPVPAAADAWKTYRNVRFGTSIEYPDRFRPGRPPTNGGGLGFKSADGASFVVYGSHNALEHDLAAHEAFILEERAKGERITYKTHGENWHVLSGTRGNTEFYERYLLSHRGEIINAFVITYPVRLRKAYDPIVTRMSKSLRAGRGDDTEGTP